MAAALPEVKLPHLCREDITAESLLCSGRRRLAVWLIVFMCLFAMGLGFYRGWSDGPTAASDTKAQVTQCWA